MDDRFFTAWFPVEAIVCGRRLKAFTTYHFLLLSAIKSPFIADNGLIQPVDLLRAVRCCTKKYGDTDLFPTLRDWIWRKRMERNERLFREQCVTFHQFLNSHASGPRFWQTNEGGQALRELTGPSALVPIVASMRDLHFSESEAWNMSLGKLQWYNAESAELAGSERRFLDETDLNETEESLRRADEELYSKTDKEARDFFAQVYEGEDLDTAMKEWRERKEAFYA